ncbi:hypothetical protein FHS56_000600 [Thermonema lapsum]|uniref:PI-PLC Y-box domain-containing protein n=1 Tax=Thermonema lapsum TaxID=28195 RepID=A0A846MNN9_9BACT|nr:hypothetical protein [Thermonema lapsum]
MKRFCPYFFTLILTICLPEALHAQRSIEGVVQDTAAQPLPYANVLLTDSTGQRIYAHSITDEAGRFMLSIADSLKHAWLEFSFYGYATRRLSLAAFEQLPPPRTVRLSEAPLQIREVKIEDRPVEIRSDTVVYDLNQFLEKQDISLEEVLRRMPGIEVLDNGTIRYKGKAINRFYVEGLNLLDANYTLASRNMRPQTVERIEVYENHQPVKMLDSMGVRSDAPAMNVILKEEFKGKADVVNTVAAGIDHRQRILGAYHGQWMRFGSSRQSLHLLKANNTGEQLAGELQRVVIGGSATWDNVFSLLQERSVYGVVKDSPPFKPQLFLYNQSASVALNGMLKNEREVEWKSKLHYSFDQSDWQPEARQRFFLPADTIDFVEPQRWQEQAHYWRAEMQAEKNLPAGFMRHYAEVQGDASAAQVLFPSQAIEQRLEQLNLQLAYAFSRMRPTAAGGAVFQQWQSRLQIGQEQLALRPGLFPQVWNGGEAYEGLDARLQPLRWMGAGLYALRIEAWDMEGSLQAGYAALNPAFERLVPEASPVDSMSWQAAQAYIQPGVSLKRTFRWGKRNELVQAFQAKPYWLHLPTEEARWLFAGETRSQWHKKIDLRNELYATFRLAREVDAETFYSPRPLLHDYRTVYVQGNRPFVSDLASVYVTYAYSDLLKGIHWRLMASGQGAFQNYQAQSRYIERLAITEMLPERVPVQQGQVEMQGGKYLSRFNASVGLHYRRSWQAILRRFNGIETRLSNQVHDWGVKLDFPLATAWRYEGQFQYTYSLLRLNEEAQPGVYQWEWYSKLHYVAGSFKGAFSVRWQHNESDGSAATLLLGDLSASWRVKRMEMGIKATNLWNVEAYRAFRLSENTLSELYYPMRPLSVLLSARWVW